MKYRVFEPIVRNEMKESDVFLKDEYGGSTFVPDTRKKLSSYKVDHYYGFSSNQLSKDHTRETPVLKNSHEIEQFEKCIAQLNGKDYCQGDLFAGFEATGIATELKNNYADEGLSPEPIWDQRITYIREDGTLGGVNILYSPLTDQVIISTVYYPKSATSYAGGVVQMFMSDNLSKEVCEEKAHRQATAVDQSRLNQHLEKAINNPDISNIVQNLVTNRKTLLTDHHNRDNLRIYGKGYADHRPTLKKIHQTDVDVIKTKGQGYASVAITSVPEIQHEIAIQIEFNAARQKVQQKLDRTLRWDKKNTEKIACWTALLEKMDAECLNFSTKIDGIVNYIETHRHILGERRSEKLINRFNAQKSHLQEISKEQTCIELEAKIAFICNDETLSYEDRRTTLVMEAKRIQEDYPVVSQHFTNAAKKMECLSALDALSKGEALSINDKLKVLHGHQRYWDDILANDPNLKKQVERLEQQFEISLTVGEIMQAPILLRHKSTTLEAHLKGCEEVLADQPEKYKATIVYTLAMKDMVDILNNDEITGAEKSKLLEEHQKSCQEELSDYPQLVKQFERQVAIEKTNLARSALASVKKEGDIEQVNLESQEGHAGPSSKSSN